MEQWPFAGREASVELISRALRSAKHAGVVVAGPAGVGKSRLAFEVLHRQKPGRWHVGVVRATQSANEIAFGAIAHLLPAAAVPRQLNPLSWAADQLVLGAGAKSLLLVVDDAQSLDQLSAAAVHLLAHTRRARLLVTIRTGEAAPDPVLALWKDDLAVRIDLDPLTLDETTEVLAGALGGVAAQTADRLWRLSQGNALLLRELVVAAHERGVSATDTSAFWRLTGDLPLSPRLTDLIDGRMGRVSEAERDALEYVAFGEPLAVDLLARLVGTAAMERAEDRGLIEIWPEQRRLVAGLAHPLFGELARSRCPTLRTRRRLAALAGAVQSVGARRRGELVRVAVWQLDSGGAVDPALFLKACRQAWGAHDYALARRLGRAAFDRGGGVDAALLLASVLNTGDGFAEAEEVLATAWRELDQQDEDMRTQLVLARAYTLGWGLGRQDEALDLLHTSEVGLGQSHNRQELTLQRMKIVGTSQGRWAEAARLGAQILADPASPAIAAGTRVEQGWLMLYLGRPLDAVGFAEEVLRDSALWMDTTPHWTGDMCTLIMQASQSVGSMDIFDAAVRRAAAEVGHSEIFANTVMVNRGIGALLRGQVATAVALLREAQSYHPVGSRAMAGDAELARALAYLGDVAGARHALGLGEQQVYVFRKQKTPLGVRLAAVWVAAAAGDVSAALDLCLDNATFFQQEGAVRRELVALHDAVRLGGAGRVAKRLAELGLAHQGALAALCAAHALAAMAGDGPGLERAGEQFARFGRLLHAAEAYAQASAAFRDAGAPAAARRASARAGVLADDCEGAMTPALTQLSTPALTTREREIALLASGGLSSAQIAGKLVVSVRTIDNHLRAIYAKLSIAGRAGLPAALGQQASPGQQVRLRLKGESATLPSTDV